MNTGFKIKKGEIWLLKDSIEGGVKTKKQRKVVVLVNEPYLQPHNFWFCAEVEDWKPIFDKYPFPNKIRVAPSKENGFILPTALDEYKVASIIEMAFIRKVGTIDTESLRRIIDIINEKEFKYL